MQRLLNEIVTLFVVLDPFSTLPVFLALTRGLDPAPARRMAIRAVVIAGAVLLFFVIAGQALLRAMGIPLSSFQLAGSVVLFLFGLRMIFGEPNHEGGPNRRTTRPSIRSPSRASPTRVQCSPLCC